MTSMVVKMTWHFQQERKEGLKKKTGVALLNRERIY